MSSRAPGALSTSRPLRSRAVLEDSVARCRSDRSVIKSSCSKCLSQLVGVKWVFEPIYLKSIFPARPSMASGRRRAFFHAAIVSDEMGGAACAHSRRRG